jgi:hypothetical protein
MLKGDSQAVDAQVDRRVISYLINIAKRKIDWFLSLGLGYPKWSVDCSKFNCADEKSRQQNASNAPLLNTFRKMRETGVLDCGRQSSAKKEKLGYS